MRKRNVLCGLVASLVLSVMTLAPQQAGAQVGDYMIGAGTTGTTTMLVEARAKANGSAASGYVVVSSTTFYVLIQVTCLNVAKTPARVVGKAVASSSRRTVGDFLQVSIVNKSAGRFRMALGEVSTGKSCGAGYAPIQTMTGTMLIHNE